jgi:hypothetical protein
MSEILNDTQKLERLVQAKKNFFSEIGKIVIGQKVILDQMLIALLTRGHTLLVGVPGLAKTLLIKSMAEICDLSFKRIQFTPDLMPIDITGTELIDIDPETEKRTFRFYKGPIFGNLNVLFSVSGSMSINSVPVISIGIRSGVNWILLKLRSQISAIDLIKSVFASPGTPTSSVCPRVNKAISIWSNITFWPITIFPISEKKFFFA